MIELNCKAEEQEAVDALLKKGYKIEVPKPEPETITAECSNWKIEEGLGGTGDLTWCGDAVTHGPFHSSRWSQNSFRSLIIAAALFLAKIALRDNGGKVGTFKSWGGDRRHPNIGSDGDLYLNACVIPPTPDALTDMYLCCMQALVKGGKI